MKPIFLIISMLLCACIAPKKQSSPDTLPIPSGRTFVTDDAAGVSAPSITAVAVYGDSQIQEVEIQVGALTGVSFDMVADAVPIITVTSLSEVAFRAIIYGPQDELGLWGEHLLAESGTLELVIDQWTAPKTGHYLLLVQPLSAVDFTYTVEIDCSECEENPCKTDSPCNIYCPRGRAIDVTTGCFECECAGAGCITAGCANEGDQCVLVCGDERCALGESCVSGQCEESGCNATCSEDESCVDGVCIVAPHECVPARELCEGECGPEYLPVCGEQDGQLQTFRNACFAACADTSSPMPGECDRLCREDTECMRGQVCIGGQCSQDPSCGCDPSLNEPICGRRDGVRKSFKNRCQLRCEGFEEEHPGRCIEQPRCQSSLNCRAFDRCVVVSDSIVEGNQRRCLENPQDSSCVRACTPRQRCENDANCPNDHQCVPYASGKFCLPSCDERGRPCSDSEVCVSRLLDQPIDPESRPGICVTKCSDEGACHAELNCVPQLSACLPCDQCAEFPMYPMCIDGERIRNACFDYCSAEDRQVGGEPMPITQEVCNNLDDNCDGFVDENLERDCALSVRTREECRGVQRCDGGVWSACELIPLDMSEACNGIDDDCDGLVDEELSRRCETASDLCPSGRQVCVEGEWTVCEPIEVERREVCNRKDDDCDGQIDEGAVHESGEFGCTSCEDCNLDWAPVCTEQGIVPNECFRDCYGLETSPRERCGDALVVRCSSDRDCVESQCRNGERVCGAITDANCQSFDASGSCFVRFGGCGCDRERGVCGFLSNDDVAACLNDLSDERQPDNEN